MLRNQFTIDRYTKRLKEGDRVRVYINYHAPDIIDVREGTVINPDSTRMGWPALKMCVQRAGRIVNGSVNLDLGPYRSHARRKPDLGGLEVGNLAEYVRSFQYHREVDDMRIERLSRGHWVAV